MGQDQTKMNQEYPSISAEFLKASMKTYEFSRSTWKYCNCLTNADSEERSIVKSDGKLYARFFCSECEFTSVRSFKQADECFTCPAQFCSKIMSFNEFKERSCCFDAKFGDIKDLLIKTEENAVEDLQKRIEVSKAKIQAHEESIKCALYTKKKEEIELQRLMLAREHIKERKYMNDDPLQF